MSAATQQSPASANAAQKRAQLLMLPKHHPPPCKYSNSGLFRAARPASAHAVTPLSYWPETPATPQASFPESPHRDISVRRHCLQQTKKKAPSPCEVTCYPYKSTFQYSSDKDTCYPCLSPHPARAHQYPAKVHQFLATALLHQVTTLLVFPKSRLQKSTMHDISLPPSSA